MTSSTCVRVILPSTLGLRTPKGKDKGSLGLISQSMFDGEIGRGKPAGIIPSGFYLKISGLPARRPMG
jgi:hypothetical protein